MDSSHWTKNFIASWTEYIVGVILSLLGVTVFILMASYIARGWWSRGSGMLLNGTACLSLMRASWGSRVWPLPMLDIARRFFNCRSEANQRPNWILNWLKTPTSSEIILKAFETQAKSQQRHLLFTLKPLLKKNAHTHTQPRRSRRFFASLIKI